MNAKQAALETKDLAEDLQDRLNTTMDSFERDKNKTKELIQRVKDYLLGQGRTESSLFVHQTNTKPQVGNQSLEKKIPDCFQTIWQQVS